jgi:hypothetical protein
MTDAAVYFPYIEVPESPSLTRVLLYWDSLASIVPADVSVSARMRKLVDLELVEMLDPGFHERFIHRDEFRVRLRGLLDNLPGHGLAPPRRSGPDSARISVGKGTWGIWAELEERGLVRIPETTRNRHRGWIYAHRDFASLYMALLAATLGEAGDVRRVPVTDQRAYFRLVDDGVGTATDASIDRVRAGVLHHVLPAPDGPVDHAEVAAFKAKHGEALRRLRRTVETEVLDCARELDSEWRRRRVEQAAKRLAAETEEVRRRMDEWRWPSLKNSMCAVALGVPAIAAAVGTGHPGLAPTGAVPLIVEVAKAAFDNEHESEPMFYAALAQQRFGSPP